MSHGVYMNKYLSEYKSMEKRKYFSLQRKKAPLLGFGFIGMHQDRPTYRIVTRNLGNHNYDVAYSDNLEDIRNNEWHYCIHELEKEMPKFDDPKTRRKWIVAHFTTLAIKLGSTADKGYFEHKAGGGVTHGITTTHKSEPDIVRLAEQPSQIGGRAKSQLLDTRSSLPIGLGGGTRIQKIQTLPSSRSTLHEKKHQVEALPKVESRRKAAAAAATTTETLRSKRGSVALHHERRPLGSAPPRRLDSQQSDDDKPWPLSGKKSGPRTSLPLFADDDDYDEDDDDDQSNARTPRTRAIHRPAREGRAQSPTLMFPLQGRGAFMATSSISILLTLVANGSSSLQLAILLTFLLTICWLLCFTEGPLSLHFHVDVEALYRLHRRSGTLSSVYRHRPTPPGLAHISRMRPKIPSSLQDDVEEDGDELHRGYGGGASDDRIGKRRNMGSLKASGRERRDAKAAASSASLLTTPVKLLDESDDEEFVGVQMTVLPHPLANGDVVRLTLEINGLPIGSDDDDHNSVASLTRRRSKKETKASKGNRSESMLGMDRALLGTGRIIAGITTSRRSIRKWEPIEPSTFKLRCGPDYRRNGFKKPSVGSFYDIAAVDTFRSKEKKYVSNIGNKVDMSELIQPGEDGWYHGLPRIWVVVLQIPDYAPSVLASVQDGEGVAICFYFKLNKRGEEAAKEGKGCAKVMKKFLREPLTISDADRGPHQWKNMVRLANSDELQIGWVLRGYVQKYNAKPFLSRNCKSYYKGSSHFEVNVDIHRFNYVSRQGMYQFRSLLKQLTLDIGFVVQCDTDDEMPEKLLGCVRLKALDAENDAVSLPLKDAP